MFHGLPDKLLRDLVEKLAKLSFESITITRSSSSDGPKIIFVNEAFTRLTGYASSEVIGQTPSVLQGSETDPAALKRLDETVKRGETFHGTVINYRKDGTSFEMEWKVTPIGSDSDADYYMAVQREGQ